MKKKLIIRLFYSVVLFLLSAILLFQVTLGWFPMIANNDIENIDFFTSSVVLILYQGVDENYDGIPDKDESDVTIYNVISSENIVIQNIYPMFTIAYKAYYNVTASGGFCNLTFIGLSPPDEMTPDVDITKALRINYIDPVTSQVIDSALFDLMDQNRNAAIISHYLSGNQELSFEFTIYMDGDAGNEYKNEVLSIENIVLSITQE